jgi:hypothetical protein
LPGGMAEYTLRYAQRQPLGNFACYAPLRVNPQLTIIRAYRLCLDGLDEETMKTIDYLKQAKRRLGIESDYALAPHLGLTRSGMSRLSNGKTTMSDETALKMAAIIGIQPAIVLADMHAEREKNPELQAVWRNLVDKLALGFEVLISCTTPHRCLGNHVTI